MKTDAVSGAKTDTGWISGIDGLRAFAVLAVLVHHANTAIFTNWALGNVGVAVFFSISGFLAYYVLWKDERKLGEINYNYFLMRRILRIWPAYFAVIGIAMWLATPTQLAETSQIPLFTFTINWHAAAMMKPELSTLGVLWSIAVEEQFYVLAPFMYLALRSRHWMAFSIAIIVMSNVGRLIYMTYFGPSKLYSGLYFVTYAYADIFLGGALAAKWFTEGGKISLRMQWILFAASASVIAAMLRVWTPMLWAPYHAWAFLPYFVLAVASSALLVSVSAPHRTVFNSVLSSRPMRLVGKLSFSLYLVHVLVLTKLGQVLGVMTGVWYNALFAVAVFSAAGLLFGWEWIFLQLKKRIRPTSSPWPAIIIWGLLTAGTARFFFVAT